jgi:hypothetical protein
MGAGLPHTPTRPWQAERLRVSSDRNVEEPGSTGIGRSRFAPALVAPVRQREVTAIVVRRNPPSRLGDWRRVGLLGPRQNLTSLDKQERLRSDADLGEHG